MPVFRFSSIPLTFSSSHPHFSYAFFSVRFSIHFFFVLSCCRSYAPFSFTFQLMAQLYFRRTYTSPLIAKKGAQQMCQALFFVASALAIVEREQSPFDHRIHIEYGSDFNRRKSIDDWFGLIRWCFRLRSSIFRSVIKYTVSDVCDI